MVFFSYHSTNLCIWSLWVLPGGIIRHGFNTAIAQLSCSFVRSISLGLPLQGIVHTLPVTSLVPVARSRKTNLASTTQRTACSSAFNHTSTHFKCVSIPLSKRPRPRLAPMLVSAPQISGGPRHMGASSQPARRAGGRVGSVTRANFVHLGPLPLSPETFCHGLQVRVVEQRRAASS